MKNIFKYLLVALVSAFVFTSCDRSADRDWTTPEPSFTLYNTTLGAAVLYPTMENNPFILRWDNSKTTGGTYSVVISNTEDFATKVELGTSTSSTFTTTIGELNTAMLQAGLSPYSSQNAYIRVETGAEVSNSISFMVTPYPSEKPVIKNPTAGQLVTLNAEAPLATATTILWSDYSYGVAVEYKVELAAAGSSNFQLLGTTTDETQLAVTNYTLNDIAIKAGLPVNVASSADIRVTATTTSTGGTITKTSDVVTFKVAPYQPAFVDFYLVGGGTAVGWNAGGAQLLKNTNEISEIYTYLEQDGEFRFLGQQDWGPTNYSLNASGINDSYKYFNTWSTNLEPSGNENMKFTGNSGMYKITIDQNSRDITVTPSALPTLPTNLYLVGSLNGWDANNALPMEQVNDGVYEYTIAIPDGAQFKFIGQQAWGDLEWANIHTGGNSGFLGPKGDNDNIQFDGGGALYKITANIKLGTYKLTPQ